MLLHFFCCKKSESSMNWKAGAGQMAIGSVVFGGMLASKSGAEMATLKDRDDKA
jgi:hypothetical protein